jgi:hypothetical protein
VASALAAHRDYPMISLDNNAAERALRRPVVTRKNAYGSRNEDAARLAARIWTVTATAEMAGLNVLTYLTAYLDKCGRNAGKPLTGPELERFLRWNAAPEDLRAWAKPPAPGQPHRNSHRNGVTANTVTPPAAMPNHGTSEYLRSFGSDRRHMDFTVMSCEMAARIIGPAAQPGRVCLDFVAAFTLVPAWIASLRAGYQDHTSPDRRGRGCVHWPECAR